MWCTSMPRQAVVPRHLSLYLRGENLTDDRTADVFSLGARGVAVFAGVRLELR
jgi:hypothetical protein